MAYAKDDGIYKGDSVYMLPDTNIEGKETFRFAADLIAAHWGGAVSDAKLEFIDFGCATGALQRHLAKVFLGSSFLGVDITPNFIAAAEAPRSAFEVGDLRTFQASRQWDVVTLIGTLSMFDNFVVPLERLLKFVRPGGIIIADGGFNRQNYDVEVRFRSRGGNEGQRTDWEFGLNQFSCATVSAWLEGQALEHNFSELSFPVDIPQTDGPYLRSFTRRLEDGTRLVMNDLNLLLPQVFLSICP